MQHKTYSSSTFCNMRKLSETSTTALRRQRSGVRIPSGAPVSTQSARHVRGMSVQRVCASSFVRRLVRPAKDHLLSQRGVEDAIHFHDVIVKQALDFDHRARWIWRFTPEFCLRLVDHGCEPAQVAHVNGYPYAVLQARTLGLSNQPDVEQGLTNAGLGLLHQSVSRRIDALHAGDKDEIAGSGAKAPGTLRFYGAGWIEGFNTVRRRRLRKAETWPHRNRHHASKT